MSKRDKKTATNEAAPERQDAPAPAADAEVEPAIPATIQGDREAAPEDPADKPQDRIGSDAVPSSPLDAVLAAVDEMLRPLRERLDALERGHAESSTQPDDAEGREPPDLGEAPGALVPREDPVPGEVERAREAHARLERGEAVEVGAGVYRYLARRPRHLSGGFGRRPSVVLPAAPEGARWVGVVGSARGGRGAGAVTGSVVHARGHVVAELEVAGSAATEIDMLLFSAPALPGAPQSR